MRGGKFEQDLQDMAAQPTADMARRYPGSSSASRPRTFSGPEWAPVERAVEAGTIADVPVMVDFGSRRPERPLSELVTAKLRPGDIYTHVYSGIARRAGSVGQGEPGALGRAGNAACCSTSATAATSFAWRIAVPAIKEGFLPDTISTDMHVASMSGGMKDMPNVMSKFLALGLPLDEIIRRTTWNAARAIRQDALGHLSTGADADVAVWRIEKGQLRIRRRPRHRLSGTQKIVCELTLRDGKLSTISTVWRQTELET